MHAAIAVPGSASTILTHVFGRGLADERYVVERFQAMADGDIRRAPGGAAPAKGRRKAKRTIASLKEVRRSGVAECQTAGKNDRGPRQGPGRRGSEGANLMAVTITVAELASAVRIGDSTEETAQVTRLLAYATTAIERHLGDEYAVTPAAVVDEAVVRVVGYLYDQPTASRGAAFANAIRNSGAGRMLLPYVVHRAGPVGGE